MKEFIDSVKALGEKMTGKKVEGTELVGVVDDIAKKYEGGGTGGSGSNYLMTTMDYFQVVGKHISVDALIALLEKYQVNLDAELDPQRATSVEIDLNEDTDYKSIRFGYNVCAGGPEIYIFDIQLEDLETATTFRTILTTNKEKIESFEITKDNIKHLVEYTVTGNLVINNLYSNGEVGEADWGWLTIQEALSIFK